MPLLRDWCRSHPVFIWKNFKTSQITKNDQQILQIIYKNVSQASPHDLAACRTTFSSIKIMSFCFTLSDSRIVVQHFFITLLNYVVSFHWSLQTVVYIQLSGVVDSLLHYELFLFQSWLLCLRSLAYCWTQFMESFIYQTDGLTFDLYSGVEEEEFMVNSVTISAQIITPVLTVSARCSCWYPVIVFLRDFLPATLFPL